MIVSFRQADDGSKLPPDMLRKLRIILSALDAADQIDDLAQPGFRLHPLRGDLKGFWAVTVRTNWRVIFRFESGKALDMDFIDYH